MLSKMYKEKDTELSKVKKEIRAQARAESDDDDGIDNLADNPTKLTQDQIEERREEQSKLQWSMIKITQNYLKKKPFPWSLFKSG